MTVQPNKKVDFEKDDFLWKYLDLHKFFSFVLNKELFFTRLDNFHDPLEGLTDLILNQLDSYEQTPDNEIDLSHFSGDEIQKILAKRKKIGDFIIEKTNESQRTQFANCWFVGKKESFAMWNIYSNPDSVAIRYKPQDLLSIVIPSAESYVHKDFDTFIYGFVDYDDIWPYDHYREKNKNIIYSGFKKDQSYIHEREFRFLTAVPNNCIGKYDCFELPLGDISKDNFYVFANPYMDNWKVQNLKKLLKNYTLDDKLIKSQLRVKKKLCQQMLGTIKAAIEN